MRKSPVHAEVYLRKDEPVERAMRRLKKQLKKSGIFDILKEKRFFKKPSVKKREKRISKEKVIRLYKAKLEQRKRKHK